MFIWIDQIIAEIPGPRRKDWITLPGLQEITRNTVSAHLQQDSNSLNDPLVEASQLIRKALETRLDDSPASQNNRFDWILRVSRLVPKLNKWYFTYGLLDCAIQLGRTFGPRMVVLDLQQTLHRLAFESIEEHFRWKAVSHVDMI